MKNTDHTRLFGLAKHESMMISEPLTGSKKVSSQYFQEKNNAFLQLALQLLPSPHYNLSVYTTTNPAPTSFVPKKSLSTKKIMYDIHKCA